MTGREKAMIGRVIPTVFTATACQLLLIVACCCVRADEPEQVPELVARQVRDAASYSIYSLDVSADGKQVAWCGFMGEVETEEYFEVADIASLERVATCRYGGVTDLAFDPRGGRLALFGHDPLVCPEGRDEVHRILAGRTTPRVSMIAIEGSILFCS